MPRPQAGMRARSPCREILSTAWSLPWWIYYVAAPPSCTGTRPKPRPAPPSVGARAAFLRDPRPFDDLGSDPGGEMLARIARRGEGELLELLFRLGGAKHFLYLGVELVEDRARGLCRRAQPDPADALEPGIALFRDRRHVGEKGRALRDGDAERAQLPRLHLREHAGHGVRHHREGAAHDLRLRLRAALERDVVELDAVRRLEGLHGEVAGRSGAERAVGDLAGLRLRRGDEVLERLVGRVRAHHDRLRREADVGDRLEIPEGLLGKFSIDSRVDAGGTARTGPARVGR